MKILPTIGPETIKLKNLKFLLSRSDFVRLNSSHNSIIWHKNAIKKIKKINPNSIILVDFPGVKPRTDNKKEISIKKNDLISFSYKKNRTNTIPLTKPLPIIKKNKYFTLDDGKIIFKTVTHRKNEIIGKSLNNYKIRPKKGLNIPGSVYDDLNQQKIFLKFFNIFKKSKLDAVGLSFVQNKNIIIKLKKKFPKIIIVSKIENSEGLKNADEISKYSDVVMIDRGDLSAEIGDAKLYDAILKISNFTKKYGKPLIMATENLETMYRDSRPTKNDIISLGFADQVQSDIIMLSEETAISKNWKSIFNWLNKFLKPNKLNDYDSSDDTNMFWNAVDTIRDFPLVVFTKKGLMLSKIFKKNVRNKVYIFTDTIKTKIISNFYNNATCLLTKKFDNKNISKFYYSYLKKYKNLIFKKNNKAFLITISFPKKGATANSLSLLNKKDI